MRWLAGRLTGLGARSARVLDYGCGTGGTSPELLEQLHAQTVVGVDASRESLDVARKRHADPRLRFTAMSDLEPSGQFEVAYCNGVFHHVEPDQRLDALGLRPSLARPTADTSASGKTTPGIRALGWSCGAFRSIATRSSCRRRTRASC